MSAQPSLKRERSRGVAALELALSLVFLMPLMLSVLDYGYYFYVGSNAEDAARVGVRRAVKATNGAVCGSALALMARANGETPATGGPGIACMGGAAYCYMNEPPLGMGGASSYTTVTLTCLAPPNPLAAVNPTWQINVTVDFPPAIGFVAPWMPPSPIPNRVRYRTTLVSN
jgi:hypothetical protein